MTGKKHRYAALVEWVGNRGEGTRDYKSYSRDHLISVGNKPAIPGSSDPAFRGDPTRYNPEEMLVASLSACHMLWYLHLCAEAGVAVVAYSDRAEGEMIESAEGSGRFASVLLRPEVRVKEQGMLADAIRLHEQAHKMCFIANSVNFPVSCVPNCSV